MTGLAIAVDALHAACEHADVRPNRIIYLSLGTNSVNKQLSVYFELWSAVELERVDR